MIVDGAQRSHAPIGDVGAVFLGEFFVPDSHEGRIVAQFGKGLVKPIGQQPLDVIPIVVDRPIASALFFICPSR